MKKIVTLFQRNYDGDRLVRDEVTPGAEWVLAGEGVATRKMDGTCCLVHDGKLYKRYEVKPGGKPPANFEPANEIDEATGKQQGWVPVGDAPDDRWHREAFANGMSWSPIESGKGFGISKNLAVGTYELIGPKIQGNPEGSMNHLFMAHGECILPDAPRDFEGIKAYLGTHDIEGIVWHHPRRTHGENKNQGFRLEARATMTIDEVVNGVAEVAADAEDNDFECAHRAEDKLYHDVLKAISDGAVNAQQLAAAAIATKKLDFTRWYS